MSETTTIRTPSEAWDSFHVCKTAYDAAQSNRIKLKLIREHAVKYMAKALTRRVAARDRNIQKLKTILSSDAAVEILDLEVVPNEDEAIASLLAVLDQQQIPIASLEFVKHQTVALRALAAWVEALAAAELLWWAEKLAPSIEEGGPMSIDPRGSEAERLVLFANSINRDAHHLELELNALAIKNGPLRGSDIDPLFDADLLTSWLGRFESAFPMKSRENHG